MGEIRENVRKNICWIVENHEDGNASEFSRKIGVSPQTACNWQKGRNTPDVETLAVIVRTYGTTMDWMVASHD